jgi:hypothetical protein
MSKGEEMDLTGADGGKVSLGSNARANILIIIGSLNICGR